MVRISLHRNVRIAAALAAALPWLASAAFASAVNAQAAPCAQATVPVAGKQTVAFGQRLPDGRRTKGVEFKATAGSVVVAPCAGLVVYAGEFRNYGNLVILSTGGGHHLLLAGLTHMYLDVGQSVQPGQPVGALARSAAADSERVLLVELRRSRRQIDPAPLWRRN